MKILLSTNQFARITNTGVRIGNGKVLNTSEKIIEGLSSLPKSDRRKIRKLLINNGHKHLATTRHQTK